MKTKKTSRQPNSSELEELAHFNSQKYGYSSDPCENFREAYRLVEQATIAVFDDYVTGDPSYSGKLMMVVWDGSPSQYEVYTWYDNKIVLEEQDEM